MAKDRPKPVKHRGYIDIGRVMRVLKIRDLKVGSSASLDLVIKSADIRLTKAQKPFLSMELFDGTDTIASNNWDWGDAPAPAKNTVIAITAQVTEWAGKPQLNIKSQRASTLGLEVFAPVSDVNVSDYFGIVKTLIGQIKNPFLSELTFNVFKDNQELWKVSPAAKNIHHAYIAGNLQHCVDTALKAQAIAKLTPMCNEDLCIAGGLLHDLGKLWGYTLNGVIFEMTIKGSTMEHIVLGTLKLEEYRTEKNSAIVDLLQHIMVSHHGLLEYGSPVTPKFMEAWVIHLADMVDSKCRTVYELNKKCNENDVFTAKEWSLENQAMITQYYIAEVMQ